MVDKSSLKEFGLTLGKFRGKGGFGEVRECTRVKDEKKFAVKILRLDGLTDQKKLSVRKEANLMSSLKHENLLTCIEKHEDANFYYIVMELADEDLSQIILKQRALSEYLKERQLLDEGKVI